MMVRHGIVTALGALEAFLCRFHGDKLKDNVDYDNIVDEYL